MSKRQTRAAVSLTRELSVELKAFADEHRIPAAQIVAQGIRAVIDGRIPLAPAADPVVLAKDTRRAREERAGLAQGASEHQDAQGPGVEQSDDWGPV